MPKSLVNKIRQGNVKTCSGTKRELNNDKIKYLSLLGRLIFEKCFYNLSVLIVSKMDIRRSLLIQKKEREES